MSKKQEFGDFQTPGELAVQIVTLIEKLFGKPDLVIEPTAGLGTFLRASAAHWGKNCRLEGYEINKAYVKQASERLEGLGIEVRESDFFCEDWNLLLNREGLQKVLVLGNPPWVTNAQLGLLESYNIPQKTNFQRLRGMDALTGKSNFDISEWILIRLLEVIPPSGAVAMLCKTATARKVLRHFWRTSGGRKSSFLFRIDAKASFDVTVDACLFYVTGIPSTERKATIYSGLGLEFSTTDFGYEDGNLVSDLVTYRRYREFDGGFTGYTWRSGIKHDAANVMELEKKADLFINGLGESVEIEPDFVYPLLKSSDIGNGRIEPRKHVLVTQRLTGESTLLIEKTAPKTWKYLNRHSKALNNRKSSIYENRAQFAVFGVGSYSFAPWKVAISGLYKSMTFVVIPPFLGRATMVDDTCYTIPCQCEAEARLVCELLSSEPATSFLRSLIFSDAKRPITVEILQRLSLAAVARRLGKLDELKRYLACEPTAIETHRQMSLVMESRGQRYGAPGLKKRPRVSN